MLYYETKLRLSFFSVSYMIQKGGKYVSNSPNSYAVVKKAI